MLGFAAGWTAFALVGASCLMLLIAASLAVAYAQIAFLGHDAGHRQIFASRRANDRLGVLLGNLGIGMRYRRQARGRAERWSSWSQTYLSISEYDLTCR